MSGRNPDASASEPGPCQSQGSTDCDEALGELHAYLDGELPDADLGQIRVHLAECWPCADRATFEEQLRAIVRERCAESAPADLQAKIRARLDQVG